MKKRCRAEHAHERYKRQDKADRRERANRWTEQNRAKVNESSRKYYRRNRAKHLATVRARRVHIYALAKEAEAIKAKAAQSPRMGRPPEDEVRKREERVRQLRSKGKSWTQVTILLNRELGLNLSKDAYRSYGRKSE